MTVPTTIKRKEYSGSGSAGPFPIGFSILEKEHLSVSKIETATGAVTALTLDAGSNGYTVDITLENITTTEVVASGFKLVILRSIPILQEIDYLANSAFPAEVNELGLDYLTMVVQQQSERIDRAILLPETSSTTGVTTPEPSDGKALLWSSGALVNSTNNFDSIVADATTQAGIATGAASTATTQAGIATGAANSILNDAGFIAVAADLTGADTIGTVAADLTGADTIGTVATNITEVAAVGTNIASVISVDTNETNINAVAADATDIGIVATNIASVNTAATNIAAIIAAPTEAANAAASAIQAASTFTATSTTSSLIEVANGKAFTTQTNKNFQAGQFMTIVDSADNANYMFGRVSSYDNGTGALVFDSEEIGGTGTKASWNISISATTLSVGGATGVEVLAASGTASSVTGTTAETVLATYTLPANTLPANGMLKITSLWRSDGDGTTNSTIRTRFDGASGTIFGQATLFNGTRAQQSLCQIWADNSTSAQKGQGLSLSMQTVYGTSGTTTITSAVDTTSDVDIVLTCAPAKSGDTHYLEAYTIELVTV